MAKTLFPIGELTKLEVRKIAQELNLVTADKKDSQGLCFIGKVRLPDFLQQQLRPETGDIVAIPSTFESYNQTPPVFNAKEDRLEFESKKIIYKKEDGLVIGTHQGAHFFTKGQRKGLAVGGTKEPLFVIDTDVVENIIYVGEGKNHPGLMRNTLFVQNDDLHWVRPDLSLKPNEEHDVMARIRYRQPLEEATLFKSNKGLYVTFKNPQTAITEGQFVVWYSNDELVGSGVIS